MNGCIASTCQGTTSLSFLLFLSISLSLLILWTVTSFAIYKPTSITNKIKQRKSIVFFLIFDFLPFLFLSSSRFIVVLKANNGPNSVEKRTERNNIAIIRQLCSATEEIFGWCPSVIHSAEFSWGSLIAGLTARSWSYET